MDHKQRNMKHCYDCKYYMYGTCLHRNAIHCNHSELWTPVDFEIPNTSMLNLPEDMENLIESGIYTEEDIVVIFEVDGFEL